MQPTNPNLFATFPPPVMEARRWLAGKTFSPDQPLINVSQAAPVDPPPEALRQVIADTALTQPEAHLYGPVLGCPHYVTKWPISFRAPTRARLAPQTWQSPQGAIRPCAQPLPLWPRQGMRSSCQPHGISTTKCGLI